MQTTVQQGNWQKQWGQVVSKAWSDDDLKRRLILDPATVLQEHGIEIPYNMKVRIVEDTDEVYHLVLPPSPSGELVDEQLTGSAGYDSYSGYSGGCGRCGCGSRRCLCD
jgi:hypothetical protein